MAAIQILILEQSYIIRQGLRAILNEISNVNIHLEFSDLGQFANEINNFKPELIIFNYKFSVQNSKTCNLLKELHQKQTRIIALKDLHYTIPDNHFFDLVIEIDESKSIISDHISALIEEIVPEKTHSGSGLSEREAEILRFVAMGFINKDIVDRLFISTHTVITHRKNITRKLGIKSVAGLTVYAILNKLISEDDLNQIN